MIKIPLTLPELDVLAKVYYRDLTANFNIKSKLDAWPAASALKPVMEYLHDHFKQIITDRPDVLETHIVALSPLIAQSKIDYEAANVLRDKKGNIITGRNEKDRALEKWCNSEIKKVFNYTYFTQKDDGKIAYRHAKRLKLNTCPYCNAHFTFTIKSKRGKSRPEFDHFLDKATYPYLALSFYNLIPSCSVCNSSGVKGPTPFSIKTHLHPFVNGIEGIFQFRTEIEAVDFLVNGKDFKLVLAPIKKVAEADKDIAQKSINDFMIEDRYRYHKDIAEDILRKAYAYNNTNIELLFEGLEESGIKIFKSPAEIKELVFGNYLHPDSFHKRILSKLTKEIAEEFGVSL